MLNARNAVISILVCPLAGSAFGVFLYANIGENYAPISSMVRFNWIFGSIAGSILGSLYTLLAPKTVALVLPALASFAVAALSSWLAFVVCNLLVQT